MDSEPVRQGLYFWERNEMSKRKRKPYSETKINWAVTQGHIQGMLEKFGVDGIQWTSGRIEDEFILRLAFIHESESGKLSCQIDVPIPREKDRNRLTRMLYWFLKSKLEAVEAGFRDFEEEFLPYILDPAQKKTLYQIAKPQLQELGVKPVGFLKALPAKRK